MEEKDLLKRIKRESELHAPDNYDKIINAANASGLFKCNAIDEEAYSDGETVALNYVNKKAALIVSLASVAAICLTIALPIALSGKYEGGVTTPPLIDGDDKVVAEIDLGDSYTYGAVTTARLAESFLNEPAQAKAMTKSMASSVSSDDFNEFGTYFTALDCFLGDNGVNKKLEPKPVDYQKSIVLSGPRLNGDEFSYAMYYTEYKIVKKDYVSGNPVDYDLEGVITASWASGLSLVGERTMSSDAADAEETALKLYAYPNLSDKTTYGLMQLEFIEIDGVTVKGYSYKIVSGGTTVSEAVAYTPAGKDLVINIKDGKNDKAIFTVAGKSEDGQGYNVDYAIGSNAGLFTVKYTDNGLEYESPEDPDIDILKYRDNGDGTYSVSSYDKNAKQPETLVIPATYNDKPIVSIAGGALQKGSFKKVIISDGITRIEQEAFNECRSLTEVEFPSTLEYIGRDAFYDCDLEELSLPTSLKTIGQTAFGNCDSLKNVDIPEGVETIDSQVFFSCYSLKSVNFPASLKTLWYGAFSWCGNLEKITVASGNTVFRSVDNCIIDIANKELVAGCKTSVIPSDGSVEKIGDMAFCGSGVKQFNLPATVTVIDDNAFANCDFTSVNIPASVKEIGSGAFGRCDYIDSFTVDANNTVLYSSQNCIIERATKTLVVGCVASVIPDDGSVTSIGYAAFQECNIQKLFIPASVKEISRNAFLRSYIHEVTMEGVEIIDDYAFDSCWYLRSVTFSSNLKRIRNEVFRDCYALERAILPQGLIELGYSAFYNCTSLKKVYLPKGLTGIDMQMFYNCTNLEEVTIPNTVNYIGYQAFYNCSALRIIYFTGTDEEWKSIIKDENTWDYNIGPYDVRYIRED
ncbi:MAG: leucine-rich repeat domain-containing protein [Clostridia bacterium]|nr:leucine-rich repeat domain-containing protein [Clostridia bacterium]